MFQQWALSKPNLRQHRYKYKRTKMYDDIHLTCDRCTDLHLSHLEETTSDRYNISCCCSSTVGGLPLTWTVKFCHNTIELRKRLIILFLSWQAYHYKTTGYPGYSRKGLACGNYINSLSHQELGDKFTELGTKAGNKEPPSCILDSLLSLLQVSKV